MTYTTINPPVPPFSLDGLPVPELRAYYDWFIGEIPARIQELEANVQETKGYERWGADFSEESLDALGTWFVGQVSTRKLTREEVEEVKKNISFPVELPIDDWRLDLKTLSLCVDIGMYMGEVFRTNHPSVHWDIKLKGSRNYIDFGAPVLIGFGEVPMNPLRIVEVVAIKKVKGK